MEDTNYKVHKLAEIFPEADPDDFDSMVESVRALGRIRQSIVVYENQILDGRQRLKACKVAGVAPKFRRFEGTEEEAAMLVLDLNLNRRHLSTSQKAAVSARILGGKDVPECISALTAEKLAKKAKISRRTVFHAKKVYDHGTLEEIAAMESGESAVAPLAAAISEREKQWGESDYKDQLGRYIPEGDASHTWSRKSEADDIYLALRKARELVKKLNPDDPMWTDVVLIGVEGMVKRLEDFTSIVKFWAVLRYICPKCFGNKPVGCDCCKGMGVVSQMRWKGMPEERRMRGALKK